jgi:hypothetical protein
MVPRTNRRVLCSRFARDDKLGFLTYDVANLGTGVKITVRMVLKKTEPNDMADLCEELDLDFRQGRESPNSKHNSNLKARLQCGIKLVRRISLL